MKSANYTNTLITASADCPVQTGTVPEKAGTVAGLQYAMLSNRPYALTSDDLLHAVHVARGGDRSRAEFFATPQACLRASPLVKQFGWGIHNDAEGRITLVSVDSPDYRALLDDPAVAKTPGMRSKRP